METPTVFGAGNQSASLDNTLTIFTSEEGAAGSKVSVHKSVLQSALTIHTNTKDSAAFNQQVMSPVMLMKPLSLMPPLQLQQAGNFWTFRTYLSG